MRLRPFSILQVCMGNVGCSPMAERSSSALPASWSRRWARPRRGRPPRPDNDLDDPWGGEEYFDRVEEEIEATVQPLARALLEP
jgi:protein-tyrosine-phosphatase